MTTAFVLGGGGLLGAHEVGMLRALSEGAIRPDLVVGTSIGAINGALVAADPDGAAARLGRLWQGDELLNYSLILVPSVYSAVPDSRRDGSAMGHSGATAPVPVVTCLPDDWWDPAWQAVKSPGTPEPAPAIRDPVDAATPVAETASSGMQPGTSAPPPSWGRVLATTVSLWASRLWSRFPWHPRRLLAASMLGAGLMAAVVGTAGLVVTIRTPASAPALPARPTPIPAPSGRMVLPVSLAMAPQPARPVWVSVPVIGVRTSLVELGLNKNGTMQVPATTAVAGWYTGSARPGAIGSAVIAGHVDSRTGPGIFFWLRTLRPGEHVYVGRADGTVAVFTVTRVRMYPKDEFPAAAVYGPVPDAELRLITCGGVFDRSLGSYLSNVVVFARLTASGISP